jgi:D-serine deaminase-like pyridoxal phosphate-dependent protein
MSIARIDEATRALPAPLAAVDMRALLSNARDLHRRAGGLPIRIATKSVRCREVLRRTLELPGFAGLMAYSVSEAVWLVRDGAVDVLVAYPSVDAAAFRQISTDEVLAGEITVVIDDPQHLALIAAAVEPGGHPVRVCLDIDASLKVGGLHLGVRRSPVHSVEQAVSAAHAIRRQPAVRLVGLMFYDAQLAGVPDSSPAVRVMKRRSSTELRDRRARIVDAVGALTDLEIVNGGGTGSLDLVSGDRGLTEVAAGSGLFGPTLFDGYRDFHPEPALAYALPVTRRPAPRVRTLFGGGYVASGPAGSSRVPTPVLPSGLSLIGTEGVGEVQTPVTGDVAESLSIGDRVWWRHAKAGEVCERFASLHLVEDDDAGTVTVAPTYRGEGQCFG